MLVALGEISSMRLPKGAAVCQCHRLNSVETVLFCSYKITYTTV
jgi:hypothetical protein